jgi:hypothetical protein
MKTTSPSSFHGWATALLIVIGSLLSITGARAQGVFLTFSGGNGSQVTITWSSPIIYTLTGTTLNSGVNPYFVFQSVTNSATIFPVQATPPASPTPTYTSTGAGSTDGTQTINNFYVPIALHNNVNIGDVVFRATTDTANTFLTTGDVFTLSAGSLSYNGTTNSNSSYSGALPANGFYTTYIVDAADFKLGSGVSAIPEPSTYAAIAGAATLGLAVWRRRCRKNAAVVETLPAAV